MIAGQNSALFDTPKAFKSIA